MFHRMCVVFAGFLLALDVSAQSTRASGGTVERVAAAGLQTLELSGVRAAHFIAADQLLLADRLLPSVLRVNLRTGNVARLGRTGSGPGEYQRAAHAAPLRDGRIAVVDDRARRIVLVASDRTRHGVVATEGEVFCCATDGTFLEFEPGQPVRPESSLRRVLVRSVFDTSARRSLSLPLGLRRVAAQRETDRRGFFSFEDVHAVPFVPDPSVTFGRDWFAVVSSDHRAVQVFSTRGDQIRTLVWPERARPIEERVRRRAIDSIAALARQPTARTALAKALDSADIPRVWPAVSRVVSNGRGILVQLSPSAEQRERWVRWQFAVPATLDTLSVQLQRGQTIVAASGDSLLLLTTGPDDVPDLQLVRLTVRSAR
jgi:hypothetical protein